MNRNFDSGDISDSPGRLRRGQHENFLGTSARHQHVMLSTNSKERTSAGSDSEATKTTEKVKIKLQLGEEIASILVEPDVNLGQMIAICNQEFQESNLKIHSFNTEGVLIPIASSIQLKRVLDDRSVTCPRLYLSNQSSSMTITSQKSFVSTVQKKRSKGKKLDQTADNDSHSKAILKLVQENGDTHSVFVSQKPSQTEVSTLLISEFGSDSFELMYEGKAIANFQELCSLISLHHGSKSKLPFRLEQTAARPSWIRHQPSNARVSKAPVLGVRGFDGPLEFAAFTNHLHYPIAKESPTAVTELYEKKYPLHAMVKRGDASALRALLFERVLGKPLLNKNKKQAVQSDWKLMRKHLDRKDESGWCPLHLAAAAGKLQCLLALVHAGANLDLVTFARRASCLHLAASEGHEDIIMALLELGAMKGQLDMSGRSALECAKSNRISDIFSTPEFEVPFHRTRALILCTPALDCMNEEIRSNSAPRIYEGPRNRRPGLSVSGEAVSKANPHEIQMISAFWEHRGAEVAIVAPGVSIVSPILRSRPASAASHTTSAHAMPTKVQEGNSVGPIDENPSNDGLKEIPQNAIFGQRPETAEARLGLQSHPANRHVDILDQRNITSAPAAIEELLKPLDWNDSDSEISEPGVTEEPAVGVPTISKPQLPLEERKGRMGRIATIKMLCQWLGIIPEAVPLVIQECNARTSWSLLVHPDGSVRPQNENETHILWQHLKESGEHLLAKVASQVDDRTTRIADNVGLKTPSAEEVAFKFINAGQRSEGSRQKEGGSVWAVHMCGTVERFTGRLCLSNSCLSPEELFAVWEASWILGHAAFEQVKKGHRLLIVADVCHSGIWLESARIAGQNLSGASLGRQSRKRPTEFADQKSRAGQSNARLSTRKLQDFSVKPLDDPLSWALQQIVSARTKIAVQSCCSANAKALEDEFGGVFNQAYCLHPIHNQQQPLQQPKLPSLNTRQAPDAFVPWAGRLEAAVRIAPFIHALTAASFKA